MEAWINPYLPKPDLLVLDHLYADVERKLGHQQKGPRPCDETVIQHLKELNNPANPAFQPTVFTTWDDEHIPLCLNRYIVRPYAKAAARILRHPTDVVFLTHLMLYTCVNLPSACYLFYNFGYLHAVVHAAFTLWCMGSFTLMMHNHIHGNGILAKSYYWLDMAFPYVLEPLMGHTWDSYYYHHIKHHHVEGNGPDDLSSTLRYQRDDVWHFLHYLGRFLFFIWLDLPLYFLRKGKPHLAFRVFFSETASYAFMFLMTKLNSRAATFTLLIPFTLLRIALMIGNWGQHALVDEIEPDSDFRSSVTLIDVPSNRFCFNDGYHTAHHLNPRRHWREQPIHFLQAKEAYRKGRALTFQNIDYVMMTYKLLTKDYLYLAHCLVPMGDQIGMSPHKIAAMLRTKTKQFSAEDLRRKFPNHPTYKPKPPGEPVWNRSAALMRMASVIPGAGALLAIAGVTQGGSRR